MNERSKIFKACKRRLKRKLNLIERKKSFRTNAISYKSISDTKR